MKKYIIALAAVFALTLPQANAQFDETNNLFYHTIRTPQANLYNPAFFPTNNTFYITFPGVDLQFGSPLAFNKIIYYDKLKQQTIINLDTIFHNLTDGNPFRLNADVNIFGFGFKVHHTFVTFNTRLVNHISFGFPTSTINALLQGNVDDSGNPRPVVEVLDGDILNATSYLETGIGVGHYFEPIHLTVGLRAKLLYGIANVQTDNTYVVFNTENNYDSVSARMYYEIQSASILSYDEQTKKFNFSLSDALSLGKASTGISFDIGAKYDFGPFTFSLAINDLTAGIHWTSNVMTWRPDGGQGVIEFTGLDIASLLDHGSVNTDSLSNYLQQRIENMKPTKVDSGDYWFSIPTKINLGASFSFAKLLRAGILFHGQFDRGLLSKSNATSLDLSGNVTNTFRWNTTLTLGANLFNWAEIILGSSIVYDGSKMDFFNPGIGLVFTPFTVLQTYIMADYISSFYLTDSKAFNLKFGLNILIGKGGRSVVSFE